MPDEKSLKGVETVRLDEEDGSVVIIDQTLLPCEIKLKSYCCQELQEGDK